MIVPRPREWDAVAYDALALPHERWGADVVDQLTLSGDEHVLDAGCGTGRDTARVLPRIPGGRVTAVDASAAMLNRLRERLSDDLDRVTVLQADLTVPLAVGGRVDAVFSVAALHWIQDHAAVFNNLSAVMAPGGQLVLECGGTGNIASVLDAVRRGTGDDSMSVGWHFAGPEPSVQLLEAAGFEDVHAELQEEPAVVPPGPPLRDFLRTVILGAHLDRRPADSHDDFVAAVADEMEEPVIDYVRLHVTARRRR